jgi:hypothetical protein
MHNVHKPQFTRAIPDRRYQLGEFSVVLLGEIESTDGISYHYILAFVPEGTADPFLYITCEKNRGQDATEGSHRMRVVAPHDAQVFGSDDRWAKKEAFVEDGLVLAQQLLDLKDEVPRQVM